MYKKFLIAIICFGLFPSSLFAEKQANWSCKIQDSSAQEITQYIKNVRTVITNINNYLSEQTPSDSKLSNTTSDISRILYQSVQWDGFMLDFDYYILTPLSNEVPSQMTRDVELLESETKWLRKYLKTITKWWYANIEIPTDKICQWVENCSLESTSRHVIWEIISNNIALTNYLKKILSSQSQQDNIEAILLPWDETSFSLALNTYYWANARAQCSKEDGEFWQRIDKAIDAILLNNKESEEAIRKWEDAWELLIWAVNGETDENTEIDLLQKELSRQWLSTSQQDILIQNLKDFNNDSVSNLENNFITNSFKSIVDWWVKIYDGFKEATSWLFDEENTQKINNEKSVWLSDFNTLAQNEIITESIKLQLDTAYQLQETFLSIQQYQVDSVIWELIDIHINIDQSIKTLEDKCRLAVKVCNSQWYWDGNCGTCK